MTIREARPSDYEAVAQMEGQVFALHCRKRPDMVRPRETAFAYETFQKHLTDETLKVFVAEEDGRVVGHCMTRTWAYKDHPLVFDMTILEIDDLCVDEPYQGQDIGKRLFERAVAYAKEISADRVELMVWDFNEKARRFYERLGMKVRISRMEYPLE